MGEGFQFFDIILFAMIAAFLVLRLRSVLGRRDGHEGGGHQDPFARNETAEKTEDNVIQLPDAMKSEETSEAEPGAESQDDPLAPGVLEIQKADPSFNLNEFLSGSKIAFEMILTAYAEGDQNALEPLLSPDVFANFDQAINDREKAGEELDFTLIGIKSTEAVEVYMEGRIANVTVKFNSEQVNAIADKDGDIVDGDPDRIIEVTDFWTFARDTKSRDPNWALVATRSLD